MAVPIGQNAQWPGALGIESALYRCEHGISPGQIQFVTIPGNTPAKPYAFGNFVISDNRGSVTVKNCKITNLDAQAGPQGTSFVVTAEDRRWRWRSANAGYGAISGRYNRLDVRGKLVPWSIRSPIELARYCFEALGETRYVINLPRGLSRQDGANVDRFLRLGENFAQTTANPDVVWDYMPPAMALAQLCDIFGCRIVYQPIQDKFAIIPQGVGLQSFGNNIPADTISVSFNAPPIPKEIVIVGAPYRVQFRVALKPVGKEWDGTWIDIDELTYAPLAKDAQNQKSVITWKALNDDGTPADVGIGYISLSWKDSADPTRDDTDSVELAVNAPVSDFWTELLAKLLAKPNIANNFTFAISGNTFTITNNRQTTDATVVATEMSDPGIEAERNGFEVKSTPAFTGGKSWRSCPPTKFPTVQPTPRLSLAEARSLAQHSVFKAFKITDLDPADRKKKLILPVFGFGKINLGTPKRIQQLIPQQEKVAQVVPIPRIAGGNQRANLLFPDPGPAAAVAGVAAVQTVMPINSGILPDFYNGYSRCQSPTVTGSVSKRLEIGGVMYTGDASEQNTKESTRVFVEPQVSVEPDGTLLVVFPEYVYRYTPENETIAYIGYPELTLETGFLIMDEDTDMPYRAEFRYPLPGGVAPAEYFLHEDCQIGYVATYAQPDPDDGSGGNVMTNCFAAPGDVKDAQGRADWYAQFHMRKYLVKPQERLSAIGILPLELDGAVQQMQWSVGGGASTQASINHEFAVTTPSYPSRRRAENLPPDAAAAAVNEREREWVNRTFGVAAGNPRKS